jgi:hypothetical protein
MSTETEMFGRSADDVLEASAGGLEHNATLLVDLASAAYAAAEAWGYDEDGPGAELAAKCREIERMAHDLSLTADGRLTLNRECRRCSGAGSFPDEDPCIECGGKGYVHASEADG